MLGHPGEPARGLGKLEISQWPFCVPRWFAFLNHIEHILGGFVYLSVPPLDCEHLEGRDFALYPQT